MAQEPTGPGAPDPERPADPYVPGSIHPGPWSARSTMPWGMVVVDANGRRVRDLIGTSAMAKVGGYIRDVTRLSETAKRQEAEINELSTQLWERESEVRSLKDKCSRLIGDRRVLSDMIRAYEAGAHRREDASALPRGNPIREHHEERRDLLRRARADRFGSAGEGPEPEMTFSHDPALATRVLHSSQTRSAIHLRLTRVDRTEWGSRIFYQVTNDGGHAALLFMQEARIRQEGQWVSTCSHPFSLPSTDDVPPWATVSGIQGFGPIEPGYAKLVLEWMSMSPDSHLVSAGDRKAFAIEFTVP